MNFGVIKIKKWLPIFAAIISPLFLNGATSAQDDGFLALKNKCLKNAFTHTDSIVIDGMLSDSDKILRNKFKIEKFYSAINIPGDYFIKMKDILGWNFGAYVRNMQGYIINRHDFDTTNSEWLIAETPNFMIYYMPFSIEANIIPILGDYLEVEFAETKALLAINEENNRQALLIRSFYPDSVKSYKIPKEPEFTNGRIQIILFPSLEEFQRHFPHDNVDSQTGGLCIFSLHHNPEALSKEISINVRVAMIFAGNISLPFIAHELAHALHFIYYSDIDSLERDAAMLNEVYHNQGREEYRRIFWPTFKDRIPGNNGIFEEAIANYAMFSTGPLWRSGIVPPLEYLIDRTPQKCDKYIIAGAEGGVEFGLINLIGSKLGMGQSFGKKVGTTIFVWADFLKYLNDSSTPQQMRQLYSITDHDLSKAFSQIFGRTVKQAAAEWSYRVGRGTACRASTIQITAGASKPRWVPAWKGRAITGRSAACLPTGKGASK